MDLEKKIAAYKDLGKRIEELERQKKVLVAEILQFIPMETKSIHIAGNCVKRVRRLSIRTSIENAKLFHAVKMQEVVDKEKIKRLYEQGQQIPDVTEFEFIQVIASVKENPIQTPSL
jgi:hypothetical protein